MAVNAFQSGIPCISHALPVACAIKLLNDQDRNYVSLPLRSSSREPARLVTLEILRRFEFEPDFQLMSGVIAHESNTIASAQPQVLLKAAPYEVSQFVDPNSIPANWDQVRFLMLQPNWRIFFLFFGQSAQI